MDENQTFIFELDIPSILAIIGSIELALRHPENTGPSTMVARLVAAKMALYLYQYTDALPPELIRAWWHSGLLPESLEDFR